MLVDCIVVGGGLIGLLTARELRLRGATVMLIDRSVAGRESSWAGGGILSPLHPWRYPPAVNRLAAWSRRLWASLAPELLEHTGLDPEYTRSGMLVLGRDDPPAIRDWAGEYDETVECVVGGGGRLAAIEPALGIREDAWWMPEVAQVRNPRLLRALLAEVRRLGVVVEEELQVEGIEGSEGRVVGIRTARGRVDAPCVVAAAGAWSSRLLADLGGGVNTRPVRGQMLLFRAEPGLLRRIVLEEGRYVIPRRDGHVLAGSTLEEAGFEKEITEVARDSLYRAAVRLVPALERAPVVRQWAGLRPWSREGVPWIGAHPALKGLYVNTGHFRNGVVLGAGSARLLAQLISGEPPGIDPTPYLPARRKANGNHS